MGNHISYEFGSSTPSSAAPTAADSIVLPANIARRHAVLSNTGAVDIYLALGAPAVSGKGILLKAGSGAYQIAALNLFRGDIHAIAASGTGALSILEAY